MNLIRKIKQEVKKSPMQRIVLPEAGDERVLRAADIAENEKIAKIILLGDEKRIKNKIKKLRLRLKNAIIIDHKKSKKAGCYARKLYALRKSRGMTLIMAKRLVRKEIYFSMMMLKLGEADGIVSGAAHPTPHTLTPAFQIIKTKKGVKSVSSFTLMLAKKPMLFADCAVLVNPTVEELAEIALLTIDSARALGIKPRVAMLSFSTKGSAKHEFVGKVIKATSIVRKNTKAKVDGELQADAALLPAVCEIKCQDCAIKGRANILIFPDLQSGNIGYKLAKIFGGIKTVGPILQGLAKPVNDLSRGSTVEEIVDVIALTAVQAQRWSK